MTHLWIDQSDPKVRAPGSRVVRVQRRSKCSRWTRTPEWLAIHVDLRYYYRRLGGGAVGCCIGWLGRRLLGWRHRCNGGIGRGRGLIECLIGFGVGHWTSFWGLCAGRGEKVRKRLDDSKGKIQAKILSNGWRWYTEPAPDSTPNSNVENLQS